MSSNYENTDKTKTTDLTTNYDARTPHMLKQIKTLREQNFESEANNKQFE